MLRRALLALLLGSTAFGFAACSDDDYGQDRPAQDMPAGTDDLATTPGDLAATPADLADGGTEDAAEDAGADLAQSD